MWEPRLTYFLKSKEDREIFTQFKESIFKICMSLQITESTM